MEKKQWTRPEVIDYGKIDEITQHHRSWHEQGPGWKKLPEDEFQPVFS